MVSLHRARRPYSPGSNQRHEHAPGAPYGRDGAPALPARPPANPTSPRPRRHSLDGQVCPARYGRPRPSPPRDAGGRELSVPTQQPHLRGKWRRRESNPRPRTHRKERLQACPAVSFHPPAGCRPPTDGLAILWKSRSGQLALPRRQARCWRRIPSHGPKTERRRYLTRLGGECEIVLRTCFVPGCFTRPTGDLGLQLIRRTDHVETRSPPDSEL